MADSDQEIPWFLPALALGIGGGVWFGWQLIEMIAGVVLRLT